MRRRPSKPKGLVTTATVRIFSSLAISATMGAPPVPVPPPIPAVMNTMSVSSSALEIWLRLSSAALAAHLGVGAGALAVGQFFADLNLIGSAGHVQRLLVRIDGDEVDALRAGTHHAVDHVVAAAADADHLDFTTVSGPVSNPKAMAVCLLEQFV
jgi:hypothetical protein